MKTILKFLGNAVWILLILSIVYPVGWFAWRAGSRWTCRSSTD